MIKSKFLKKWGLIMCLVLFFLPFLTTYTFAQAPAAGGATGPLPPAEDVSQCGSKPDPKSTSTPKAQITPYNCLFLEEPIGGKANYDLYKVNCDKKTKVCITSLWNGGSLTADEHGPIQAILTESPDKPYQGSIGLLYSYIGLVYNYMSGLIIGVAVLFVVLGGVQMSISGGDQTKFDEGKKRIMKAVIGLIVWFTASLILYTINPTFFTFYQGP